MSGARGNYTIRACDSSDQQGVIELYRRVFGEDAARLFDNRRQWEFEDNPARQPGMKSAWVAQAEGRVIGHLGARAAAFSVGGKPVSGMWATDLAVDEAFRGQRIASSLYEYFERDGLPLHLMLGGAVPTLKIARKHGWADIAADVVGCLPLSAQGCLRFCFSKSRFHPSLTWVKLCAGLAPHGGLNMLRSLPKPAARIEVISKFDARFDRLWESVARGYFVLGLRDAVTLEWRFGRNPNYGFTSFLCHEAGEALGYVVTVLKTEGDLRVGYVADFIALPGRRDVHDALAAAAACQLKDSGADIIMSIGLGDQERCALRKIGFTFNRLIQSHLRPRFTCLIGARALGSDERSPNPRAWFVSGFDSDMLM